MIKSADKNGLKTTNSRLQGLKGKCCFLAWLTCLTAISDHAWEGRLFNPYSAGIDFRRQNPTYVDVNFTAKIDPHTMRIKLFIMVVDP